MVELLLIASVIPVVRLKPYQLDVTRALCPLGALVVLVGDFQEKLLQLCKSTSHGVFKFVMVINQDVKRYRYVSVG